MKTVRNWPGPCDPRAACWGACWNTNNYPLPYRWAVQILEPNPPPDSLPEWFWIETTFLTDPLAFFDYARTLSPGSGEWIFRLQFSWEADPLPCGTNFDKQIARFQWSDVDLVRDGIHDIQPAGVIDPTDYEPEFNFPNLGSPPWAPGTWIEKVRVGGLVWNGDDSAAEYRASLFSP